MEFIRNISVLKTTKWTIFAVVGGTVTSVGCYENASPQTFSGGKFGCPKGKISPRWDTKLSTATPRNLRVHTFVAPSTIH